MKTDSTSLCTEPLALSRSRLADFVALTKPRIAILVLFTVATGAVLAQPGLPDLVLLLNTLLGTALVAAGASAINQVIERHTDGLMRRTENRPLPAGRMQAAEALVFGLTLSLGGIAYLALTCKHPLAVVVAAVTWLSYVAVYTPLKRSTTLNTVIGAVPGAMPPVIGWTAVTGSLDVEALALFGVVFFWQLPHFLAIAWMYRDDYARAGLHMLPVVDRRGVSTGWKMVVFCVGLVAVSMVPVAFDRAGWLLASGSAVLGLVFLYTTIRFCSEKSHGRARRVLHASLLYLPALLGLWLADHWLKF